MESWSRLRWHGLRQRESDSVTMAYECAYLPRLMLQAQQHFENHFSRYSTQTFVTNWDALGPGRSWNSSVSVVQNIVPEPSEERFCLMWIISFLCSNSYILLCQNLLARKQISNIILHTVCIFDTEVMMVIFSAPQKYSLNSIPQSLTEWDQGPNSRRNEALWSS